jgi:hypothetical protein
MRLVLAVFAVSLVLAGSAAAQDARDVAAHDLFVAGKYAEALAIYDDLHATTHHPTYLRNIGRCHQMLRHPDPAITHFQSYLREAHELAPQERDEIDGYIREMQALRVAQAPPPAFVAETRAAPNEPVTKRWWFWTGAGAVVAAGVLTAVLLSSGGGRLACPSGTICPP